MNFKHSLGCLGNLGNLNRIEKDLRALGYTNASSENYSRGTDFIAIGPPTNNSSSMVKNGNFLFYMRNSDNKKSNIREYEFNIDNEWEYKAALAIASIVNDNEFHVGEWVKSTRDYCTTHEWFDKDDIFPLTKMNGEYFEMISIVGGSNGTRGGFNIKSYPLIKLSPEEIIEHFKPKEMGKSYAIVTEEKKDGWVLPERWAVKGKTEEEQKAINAYARSVGGGHWSDISNYAGKYYMHVDGGRYKKGIGGVDYNYTEITFDQFKKYVLNMEGKGTQTIIGYNLKDKKYSKAASQIAFGNDVWISTTPQIRMESVASTLLQEAGVLGMWFEPVYKKELEDVKFTVGNPARNVVIKARGEIKIHNLTFPIGEIEKVNEFFYKRE
jgi:hypothetical protein